VPNAGPGERRILSRLEQFVNVKDFAQWITRPYSGVCGHAMLKASQMIRSYKGLTPTIPASCYVDDSAQIIGDVALGEHASVWMNAVLRGDVHSIRVGAHSNVQDCSVLHGMKELYGVFLGEYVTVGHSVTLHGCVIEDRCLIGMGSIILNGAKIGAGSIIAAGTLIPEGTVVEPGSLWMGSPGKFRRQLDEKDQETIMRYARNYLGYKDSYLAEK
jgi:carbonic anhydrase/acetyltransferase-like protein (isoleucine patch superfamily)